MATRKVIQVDEYQIRLGAEQGKYADLRKRSEYVGEVEALGGYGMWRWRIATDEGDYFVSGTAMPQAKGVAREMCRWCGTVYEQGAYHRC